jgi:adenylate cyclase
LSVLEASLRYRIPHASVCGGKARCSTCRIRVLGRPEDLPPPSRREAFVLERVGASADPAIRLACQLRPQSDVAFALLLPPQLDPSFVRGRKRIHIGEERYIVSMFVDMRGSTRLAERRLPFDTVFVINRFLAAVSQAAVRAGGQSNQFVGDGLLALFGLDADAETACRQAVQAAVEISASVTRLNRDMAEDLAEPIGFGIGIHAGVVILGDIGYRDHTVFTAPGDAVNVAARLQDLTKALECELIVSEEVFRKSGMASDRMPMREIAVRGRSEMLVVRTATQAVLVGGAFEFPATARRAGGAETAISALQVR